MLGDAYVQVHNRAAMPEQKKDGHPTRTFAVFQPLISMMTSSATPSFRQFRSTGIRSLTSNETAMAVRKVDARRQRDLATVANARDFRRRFGRVRAENGRKCTRIAANCKFREPQPESGRPA